MELTFTIEYWTQWGEMLEIEILGPHRSVIRLEPEDHRSWRLKMHVADTCGSLTYRYRVCGPDGVVKRMEWGKPRVLMPGAGVSRVAVHDMWQDVPDNRQFYSQAFTECINKRDSQREPEKCRPGHLLLSMMAPEVLPDETVVVTGSCDALGNWNASAAPEMNDALFPRWELNLDACTLPHHFEYKMVVVKKDSREVVKWEEGDNRTLTVPDIDRGASVVSSGHLFRHGQPSWRGAGVAIPVFSLRSEEDSGVGDFYDLIKLVDWAVETGQKFIQILPVNDTTMTGMWTDSYPYNANTINALHPMYLRLEAMGMLDDPVRIEYYREMGNALNSLPSLDYEKVNRLKREYTAELFALKGEETMATGSFKAFYEKNVRWLKPYAAFCVLRDIYNTPCYEMWEDYSRYDRERIDRFVDRHMKEIGLIYFQQYHLDRQLRHVTEYSRRHGVAIKGDIPIGISRTSVDAWTSPELFNLDSQAGAPPDDFSVLGQNWGFPTYNWEIMGADGFAWWKNRFVRMADYFDAYRIDHVLGFFRIWQIPRESIHGLLGHFYKALPLTPGEMRSTFGFNFDSRRFLQPWIDDQLLARLFGEWADEVRATYLHRSSSGHYVLNDNVSTQRRIADYFATLVQDRRNQSIADGLMLLLDEVLFIEDPVKTGCYHPRISGSHTRVYELLPDDQKRAFDRMYEDFYYHRHNDYWYGQAMWKLPPLIDSTGMLTCAEDLGMIPQCVARVMDELHILTLEIQRMPKTYGVRFDNPANYPYRSVCTTSTHDMSGIREWWEEDPEATQEYYNQVLQCEGKAPHFAEPWICEKIVKAHLESPAMLCILPLQDWLSIDGVIRRHNPREERINIPAHLHHYWCYRMHLTLEDLLAHSGFNRRVRSLVKSSR